MILKQKIAKLEEMQRAERRACRVQQAAGQAKISPHPAGAGFTEREVIAAAKEIIRRDRLSRKAAEGCIKQVMQDLGQSHWRCYSMYASSELFHVEPKSPGFWSCPQGWWLSAVK